MEGCSECTSPFSPQSCPEPLLTFSKLCFAMEGMTQCTSLYNMCAASSQYSNGTSPALYRYCPGYFTSSGSSNLPDAGLVFNLPTVNYAPSMLMYFHQRNNEYILWKAWEPLSTLAYTGSCIAVIFFGIVSVALRTLQSCVRLYFSSLEVDSETCSESDRTLPSSDCRKSQSIMVLGEGEEACTGSHMISVQMKQPTSNESDLDIKPLWFLCSLNTLSRNALLALILGLALTLDYLNMLVVMTYNIGLFVSVVMGYVIGSVAFMHLADQYAKVLRASRTKRRRDQATGTKLEV